MTVQHEKFDFGTVFGDGGHVVAQSKREKKFFTPEEVEAIRAQAYAEGENSATARAQIAQANAIQELASFAAEGLGGLSEAIHAHKAECVKLALVCAQRIAAEALDRFPEGPVNATLEALGQEIEKATRLILLSSNADDALKGAAQDAANMAGFPGAIQFREMPQMPKGAFEIVWSDGRASFDPEQVFNALDAALSEALDAEAYHQSRINSGMTHG